jgi:hypothetical protein
MILLHDWVFLLGDSLLLKTVTLKLCLARPQQLATGGSPADALRFYLHSFLP